MSAWRPVASTVSSACRSRSCSGSSSRLTAPACTVITETEWAITSWSSRAIRWRSSATARIASVSFASAMRRARSSASRKPSSRALRKALPPQKNVKKSAGKKKLLTVFWSPSTLTTIVPR